MIKKIKRKMGVLGIAAIAFMVPPMVLSIAFGVVNYMKAKKELGM
ncbi:hypothetical protein GCM10023331_34490 [Algivirga pacifica]|uniref:Uncharacterized protein n=1 Tax=Algivirga pacifica TaxID=1162670 RepID=A0ABP9DIM3_9BACT